MAMRSSDYFFSDVTRHEMEKIPEHMVILRLTADGSVCEAVTDEMVDFLQVSREKVCHTLSEGQSEGDWLHPDDRKRLQHLVSGMGDFLSQNYTYRIRMKLRGDFTYRWYTFSFTGRRLDKGETLIYCRLLSSEPDKETEPGKFSAGKMRKLLVSKVLDTTQDCIFWKDTQRRFVGVNRAFLEFYGFPSADLLIGRTDEEMGWHEDPDPFRRDEERVLQGESTLLVHGKCMIRGQNRDILATKAPIYDGDTIIGLVGSFIDVTEEYRQRQEIERLGDELKDALAAEKQTNENLNMFMSRMSHEMRTPMNAVIGLSSLGMQAKDVDEAVDCFHKINMSGQYLLGIINDVLDIGKIDSGKFRLIEKPTSLKDIYTAADTIIRPIANRKDVHLLYDFSGVTVHTICCDRMRVQQILINLLNNAVKFTDEGGTVRTIFSDRMKDGRVHLKIVVSDNGCGMSEEFLAQIFQPFIQENRDPDRYGTGTGLGLSISKTLAKQMGGDITVTSKEGVGSSFTVILVLRTVQPEIEHLEIEQPEIARPEIVKPEISHPGLTQPGMAESGKPQPGAAQTGMMQSETVRPDMAQAGAVRTEASKSAKQHSGLGQVSGLTDQNREKHTKNSCHILFAEDNEINREIALHILRDAGYTVECAKNGQEAVAMAEQSHPGFYDAVLMDLTMPVMDGYQAALRIRGSERTDLKQIPIVAMSADVFPSAIQRAKASGMNAFVEKPLDAEKLLTTLRDVLQSR
ncbi:MAG: ATP-binding protein [Bilifractor sp.]